MPTKHPIVDERVQKIFDDLGYDPKTRKFKEERLGENKRNLREPSRPNSRNYSPNPSYPSPSSSYHIAQPNTPFRIKSFEKTKLQSPTGTTYRYSALYRNAVVLQHLVEKFTAGLDPRKYHRYITQINDAARSHVSNIAEGYARPSTVEYLDFLGFSRASLEEIWTDIIHAKDTGLLPSRPGSTLASIGIVLKPTPPPNPSYSSPKPSSFDPLGDLKRKLGEIRRQDLTFEIFLELINKTVYLHKRTVEGLWNKLSKDEQEKLHETLKNLWSR